jgi:hypothetical protein
MNGRIGNKESSFALAEAGFSAPEMGAVLRGAVEPVLAMPGITEHRRLPVVLAIAAIAACYQGDAGRGVRLCDEALAAEERLGIEPNATVWSARAFVAVTQARTDEYIEWSERTVAICRTGGDRLKLAISLGQTAMARSLKGDDMDLAIAEAEESLALARELGVPTVLAGTDANAAFVLADVQPERAGALMHEALHLVELQGISHSPVHGQLGDVAERLGDRRLALELFGRGMDGLHWIGFSEQVGRMFRRIALLLIADDPDVAAVIAGAGEARSVGYTMTERVMRAYDRGMLDLDAALGASRHRELSEQGAAMPEHEAVVYARAAVARALDAPA